MNTEQIAVFVAPYKDQIDRLSVERFNLIIQLQERDAEIERLKTLAGEVE